MSTLTQACLQEDHLVVFGLGSNLAARRQTLHRASDQLVTRAQLRQVRRSQLYLSEPLGTPQPVYLNAAIAGLTRYSLPQLLSLALDVERHLGRIRDGSRWGPRTIDIDLLWSDRMRSADPALTVPHPGLDERTFALRPLLDVAPNACDRAGQRYDLLAAARAAITVVGPF